MTRLLFLIVFVCVMNNSKGQEIPTQKTQKKNVAILVFNGVQIIDFTGPYEVFGQAGYNVFTVAEKKDTVTTHMKLDIIPRYELSNHPKADIIVIPGGGAPHRLPKDNAIIKWVVQKNEEADYILSVCNGAFLVASSGLLDDKEATTYAPMINHFGMYAPKTKPVYNRRFVKSGKIITAGGLSAGIDAALHVVSIDKSLGSAREVANNMEYNWDPTSSYVRSQLADMHLLNVLDFNPPLFNRKVIQYDGDNTKWVCEYHVVRKETLKEFFVQFEEAASMYNWTKGAHVSTEKSIKTTWTFTDFNNAKWICQTEFATIDEMGTISLILNINRK